MKKAKLCGTITITYKFNDVEVPSNFYENEMIEYIKDNLDIILDWDKYEIDQVDITDVDEEPTESTKADWEADYYYDCMKEGTLYED